MKGYDVKFASVRNLVAGKRKENRDKVTNINIQNFPS